ncbi:Sensory transduction protein regX3 [compost metagenome]
MVLVQLHLFGTAANAQSSKQERHILVSMRMIGHRVLLNAGDSTSRVFPVEKKGNTYRISFGSAFGFNPGELAATIDRLVGETKIANSYIVEVKTCETDAVVYSYEKGDSVNPDLVPCGPRFQPEACYVLFVTILKPYTPLTAFHDPGQIHAKEAPANSPLAGSYNLHQVSTSEARELPGKKQMSYSVIALPIGSLFLFLGAFVYFRKKKPVAVISEDSSPDPDIFPLGNYRFDRKNMLLVRGQERTELSGKESDLLFLLYSNANKTLEREYILKMIWADEGDYIGRTLDVFISKLRKKLEADPGIRIVNIRGIGYKFILN